MVTLSVREWATLDAIVDNAINTSIDLGQDPTTLQALRQLIQNGIPWQGDDWPDSALQVGIELAAELRELAGSLVRADAQFYESDQAWLSHLHELSAKLLES